MMDVKIRRFGNSLGILLPKETLTAIEASEGMMLHLSVASDGTMTLSPHNPSVAEKLAKVDSIVQRYRNTLHILAQ